MSARQYKTLKGLKKESLRDNMSTTGLTLNQLAGVATRRHQDSVSKADISCKKVPHANGCRNQEVI